MHANFFATTVSKVCTELHKPVQCAITQHPISCQLVGVDNGLLANHLVHNCAAWFRRRTQFAVYPVK